MAKTFEIPKWSDVLAPKDEGIPEGFQSQVQIIEQMKAEGKSLTQHYLAQVLSREVKTGTVEKMMVRIEGRHRPYYRIKGKA
jgi:hypothetical protein